MGAEPRNRRLAHGLTLLEVLAAALVLAIAYVFLAKTGIQGMQIEGDALRRIEASLLADRWMADLEASLELGGSPPMGSNPVEDGIFRVTTEVSAYSVETPAPSEKMAHLALPPEVLQGGMVGGEGSSSSALRMIRVRVEWDEAGFPRQVLRTTFGFDYEAVRNQLDALDRAAGIQPETTP